MTFFLFLLVLMNQPMEKIEWMNELGKNVSRIQFNLYMCVPMVWFMFFSLLIIDFCVCIRMTRMLFYFFDVIFHFLGIDRRQEFLHFSMCFNGIIQFNFQLFFLDYFNLFRCVCVRRRLWEWVSSFDKRRNCFLVFGCYNWIRTSKHLNWIERIRAQFHWGNTEGRRK